MHPFTGLPHPLRRITLRSAVVACAALSLAAASPIALAVRGVSVSPLVVQGGATATGTVFLDGPSPTSGTSVVLSSSKPTIATVPAKIAIIPRAQSGTFTVTTSGGNGGCSLISARVANTNVTQTALISARPTFAPGAVNVTLPDTVVGGGPVQGSFTVATGGSGPPGAVQLTSSNPTVVVPPSVTPTTNNEGVYAGSFTVQTSPVPFPGTCSIITATHSLGQRRVLLRVTPIVQG